MSEHHENLEAALRDLGARLETPPPPDLVAAVRARLAASPTPPRRRVARLPRPVAAAVAVLLAFAVALAVSPAVRAALTDLLHVAGIDIRHGRGPTPPRTTQPLPGERVVSLAEAQRLAAFPVRVPVTLGAPDEVHVSGGQPPRIVSLIYRPGPGRPPAKAGSVAVRVDEFDGRISPVFRKFVYAQGVEPLPLGKNTGYWIAGPHELIYIDRSGVERTESARLAADTLIWQVGAVTFRLEGKFTKTGAQTTALSMR